MEKFMLKKILSVFAAILVIQGCSSINDNRAEPSRYEDPSFSNLPPIQLKVNKVDIISEFTPSFQRPNVEHLFPISIEKAARIWASERLKAVDFSSNKVAKFIIKDASVTEEEINTPDLFTANKVKYHAKLVAVLMVTDPDSLSTAETTIEAWRELTIPAHTEIDEKERYWNTMVKKLMDDFNTSMEKNINQYLNMYVVGNSHIQEY